jgi:hypothetical protein
MMLMHGTEHTGLCLRKEEMTAADWTAIGEGRWKQRVWVEGPTDTLSQCLECGSWFCLNSEGSWHCRECGAHDGDHHLACFWEIQKILDLMKWANSNPRQRTVVELCYLCHEPLEGEFEMDHVIPKSKNPTLNLLLPVHKSCNASKGARPLIKPKNA